MNKTEIISLLLLVASIIGFVITFQLEVGDKRSLLSIVSFGLLMISMDPTFSSIRHYSETKRNNVGRAIRYIIFGAGIISMFVVPIIIGGKYILVNVFLSIVLLLGILSYFSPRGWLLRRLKWLTNNNKSISIKKIWKGKTKILYADDDENGMSYAYCPAEHCLYVYKKIFLNPFRFEKEYEERVFQIQACLKQTNIPLDLFFSECDNCMCFRMSIGLQKQHATKKNVCSIHKVMREFAKNDFNKNLFTQFVFNDDSLYLETFHFQLIRAALVSANGEIEHYYPEEELGNLSHRFVEILEEIQKKKLLEKIQRENLKEQAEFEFIWKKFNHGCQDLFEF